MQKVTTADFEITRQQVDSEIQQDKKYLQDGNPFSVETSSGIKYELARGNWQYLIAKIIQEPQGAQLLNCVCMVPYDVIVPGAPIIEQFTLLGVALERGEQPFINALLEKQVSPYAYAHSNRWYDTTLGLATFKSYISPECMQTLCERSGAQDYYLLRRDPWGNSSKDIFVANALGHDIPDAKKQIILGILRKRERYEMLKRALILSRYDEKNSIQTLLVQGDFPCGKEFDAVLAESKTVVAPKIIVDMERYRSGLQEIDGLFNESRLSRLLFASAGTDIFSAQQEPFQAPQEHLQLDARQGAECSCVIN